MTLKLETVKRIDPYSTLRVSRTAPQSELKRAYRDLAMRFHPDREGGDEEKFKRITEAYSLIDTPEKRAIQRRYEEALRKVRDARRAREHAPTMPRIFARMFSDIGRILVGTVSLNLGWVLVAIWLISVPVNLGVSVYRFATGEYQNGVVALCMGTVCLWYWWGKGITNLQPVQGLKKFLPEKWRDKSGKASERSS